MGYSPGADSAVNYSSQLQSVADEKRKKAADENGLAHDLKPP
jgi:hypothetical protein